MKGPLYPLLTLTMIALDVLMAILAVLVAYYIRFTTGWIPFTVLHPLQAYSGLILIQGLAVPLVFAFRSLYRFRRHISRIDEFQKVFTAVSIATVISLAATALFARDFEYARVVLALTWVLSVAFIWVARVCQYWIRSVLFRAGVAESRVLIVGTGELGRNIAEKIRESPESGYRTAGFIRDNGVSSTERAGLKCLGGIEEIGSIVHQHRINEVIIAEPSLSHLQIMDIVYRCEREKVDIKVFPDVFQIISSEVSIDDLKGLPMLSVRDVALRGWNLTLKRAMDIIMSSAALLIFSPLMLLTALLVRLTSEGPVFYVQERVGLDGKPFPVIKFRSMRVDAERDTGPVWAKAEDPRATPVGRLLRRLSLDELPQLVNVLIGEMSVVGPRPERPHFVEQFSRRIPRYLDRHKEKTGLTGWAQVNGLRGDVSIEERTAYDLWYVEHWTPWLDLKIIARTIVEIFRGRNAY
ncbi:MAG: undecaprenyl-phosphate glucose phosphotransferase [Chloroflexi bacterium]|nr:undecaprenyl-phosphate glucose phosphotransferase [Chloroflexota bacterium]